MMSTQANHAAWPTHSGSGLDVNFRTFVLPPAGLDAIRLMRAAGKAGALGFIVPPESLDPSNVRSLASSLARAGTQSGLYLPSAAPTETLIEAAGSTLSALIVTPSHALSPLLSAVRSRGIQVFCEVTRWSADLAGLERSIDGFVLKGQECGGVVDEHTTFVLLQEFRERTTVPLLARGGITPETAAAAYVAGATGVVLDNELLLLKESPLDDPDLRKRLGSLSGSETTQIEVPEGGRYLCGLERPGGTVMAGLADRIRNWGESVETVATELSWRPGGAAPVGQTATLAAPVARRYRTLGRFITAIRTAVRTLPAQASQSGTLAPHGPLATVNGTIYPIMQGPMTRVSDVAPFIAKVADGGALPFAALALLRGPQTEVLLGEIDEALGDRPWGVGLLGFAHTDVLREQMEAIEKRRPKFAIIAGGRINQILDFEAKGIRTFVHAPTPGMIAHYLDEGVRRFIVEGRECGGHIGPLTSFVLWSAIIDTLRDHPVVSRKPGSIELVFAGGIHDAVSAAMVATIAEPLVSLGVKVGVLMGSAYVFTREIVEAGAIVPDYQSVAIASKETISLWEGAGFASRCATTPIAEEFRTKKLALEESGASAREVREEMETYSLGRLRMATKGVARIGPDKSLQNIGVEQRRDEGMYMIGQVAALHNETIRIADLHESVTNGSIAYLERFAEVEPADDAVSRPKPADVAIVGISTLLPGSDTVERYWRRILSGESAISDIPPDRWSMTRYYSEDRQERDLIYSRRGGFLDDVTFNPLDYGIPPTSLASVDPVQLLALELVSDLLDDAGVKDGDGIDRSRVSVTFGFSGGLGEMGAQYVTRADLPRLLGDVPEDVLGKLPEWTEDSFAGLLPNVAAGRVASRFNFGGTNQTVDAACASSLAAVYSAVMELESGRSDMAIAGGLDSLQSPFGYLCFSKTQALSPRGVCNTFDGSADGIVISEGLAAIALKRLADAERDGDRIYAVIKGVGASSDGRATGLTAPLPAGQKRALRRAYEQAGFDVSSVQLLEAHGTGTVAGDRAELESATSLLKAAGAAPRSTAIGSVKTLIGHTKAGAGVAGLVKVALGLHHRVLPPHALVETPNPTFNDDDCPLYLSQTPRPWTRPAGGARRAGVSAFGFGGTNFHVALEEHVDSQDSAPVDLGRELVPLAFAADDRTALTAKLKKTAIAIGRGAFKSLRNLALDVLDKAVPGHVRLGFTATSLEEAADLVDTALTFLAGSDVAPPETIHFSEQPALLSGGKLAFMFPGQGSQYPDMLREATLLGGPIADALDRAEAVLADTPSFERPGRRLSRFIYPGDAFTPADRKAQMTALTATEIAQPALGAVEAGLFGVLSDLGVSPDLVAGHSYGEFVALYAAGAIRFDDLMRLSEARGRAMVECADPATPGAMAAVSGEAERIRSAIRDFEGVVLANFNSPDQTVIAGPKDAVEKACATLDDAGITARALPVSQAFHSPLMAPARKQFEEALSAVDWRAPHVTVYGNTLAEAHAEDPARIHAAMSDHLVSSVDFVGMVRTMAADGARVFVEVGPKTVLSGLIPKILDSQSVVSIALDDARSGATCLFDGLVRLFVEGAPVDLRQLVDRMTEVAPRPTKGDPSRIWLLNGAYARKAGAPKRDVSPPVAVAMNQAPVAAASSSSTSDVPPSPSPSPSSSFGPELEFIDVTDDHLGRAGPDPEEKSDVLSDYHDVMKEFLRVQESVMLAFMGGETEKPAALASVRSESAPTRTALTPAKPDAAPARKAPEPPPDPPPVHFERVAANGASSQGAKANGAESSVTLAAVPAPVSEPVLEPVARPAPVEQEVDLLATFTSIVADKTGYPDDALDPEQDLEADLGIDSIKRMEILGAVQKVLPAGTADKMRSEMDTIAELSTIRQIVDYIDTKTEAEPSQPGVNGAAKEGDSHPFDLAGEAKEAAAVLPRYIQVPFEEPIDHLDLAPPKGHRFVITEAEDGLHNEIAAALEAGGASAVTLPMRVMNADDPAAIAEWVARISADVAPSGLIYLDGRAALPDPASLDISAWRAIHHRGVKKLFAVLQAMAPFLRANGRFVAVTETGGLFGRTLDATTNGMSAVAGAIGIVRALSLEWPLGGSKIVDLDPATTAADKASQIVVEIALESGRREVGYPTGKRTIFRTEPHSLSPPDRAPTVSPDWVIVATGGARGITAECLRTLAPHRPTLVLVGRSPLPEPESDETRELDVAGLRHHYLEQSRAKGETVRLKAIEDRIARHLGTRDIRRNVDDLAALGARVDYRSVDVCDPDAVNTLFNDLYSRYGRVDMVVHGAGLIEDAFLEKKSPESIDRVFSTKVDSAFLIARALRPETLKAICFFTSVAGRYGNAGQTDYAAANETLNRFAWDLKRRLGEAVTVKAINWGPWGASTTGAGMVTPEVRRQFESRGIHMVEALPGRDLFYKEMFWSDPAEVESVGWVADGEYMEEQRCALPRTAGAARLGEKFVLLGNATKRDNGRDELNWRFDLVNAPYVDDHRFDGIAVMPFAAVVQIMSEIPAAFGIDTPVVHMEDVCMYKGLTLEDGPIDVRFVVDKSDDGETLTVSVFSEREALRPHYRAKLILGADQASVSPSATTTMASAWDGPETAEIYRCWLSHGPRYQTLAKIDAIDATTIRATARPSQPGDFISAAVGKDWNFDPGLIDGALQTVWIWTRATQQTSTLPLRVSAVRRCSGDPTNGPLRVESEILSPPDENSLETTIRIYDAAGALCFELERLACQSSAQLNRLGGGWQGGSRVLEAEWISAA